MDSVHVGDSSFSVTFDLIQEPYNGFFVTGAEWVGIWGMAFSELAKVRLWCVCVCVHICVVWYGVCGVVCGIVCGVCASMCMW